MSGYRGGREQLWRRLMAKRGRSGLSVRKFCDQEGLRESAFYFWRRELARRDAESASGRGVRRDGASRALGDVRRQPAFLPVAMSSSTIEPVRNSAEGTIEVRLPEGTVLRIAGGVDAATLGVVLKAVRG